MSKISHIKSLLISFFAIAAFSATVSADVVYYDNSYSWTSSAQTPLVVGDVEHTFWHLDGGASGSVVGFTHAYYNDGVGTLNVTIDPYSSEVLGHPALVLTDFTFANQTVNGSTHYVTNASFGTQISSMAMGSFGDTYYAVESEVAEFSTMDFKNFTRETPAYVAFTFTYGSGTQYGWANITWHNDLSLTINEWAYTTLGDNLTIGQTSGVPEPAETACGLGVLVLGAAFLRRRDKARKLA
ncbi:MAG: hypothetical protein WC360_04180 [Opitutales bacterium]|jgi:hypothetical protein